MWLRNLKSHVHIYCTNLMVKASNIGVQQRSNFYCNQVKCNGNWWNKRSNNCLIWEHNTCQIVWRNYHYFYFPCLQRFLMNFKECLWFCWLSSKVADWPNYWWLFVTWCRGGRMCDSFTACCPSTNSPHTCWELCSFMKQP